MTHSRPTLRSPETTAVVVTCGSTPYVRRTLAGIAAQTHIPTRVVIVDVWQKGRDIGTGEDLQAIVSELGLDLLCKVRVLKAPGATNFGDAIAKGLELNAEAQRRADKMHETRTGEIPVILPDTSAGWLWLLHDDSAPDPRALGQLLRLGESGPSIGVVGAKQRDWSNPDQILEVGIDATRSARRYNPIDEDEIDQGQHDSREDVLAVGLAGAIIRRDVWKALGGLDPALGPFGDGLEFSRRARLAGYRVVVAPSALVYHKRATYLGLRSFGHGVQRRKNADIAWSFRARRRAQLYNWMLSVSSWQVPLLWLWLAILSPLRALGRFLGKDMVRARAELSAGVTVLTRPDLWLAARKRIKETQKIPVNQLSLLEADARDIRRKKAERRRAAAERRKIKDAPSELELRELAEMTRKRRIAGMIVTVIAAIGSLVALSHLFGKGFVSGGSLLPSSARLGDVFSIVTSGWIPAGAGQPGPADPAFAVALLPLLSGSSLSLWTTLGIFLSVPLAALCAWFGAGALTRSVAARVWAATIWAFAPALLIALGQGRLGPVLAHALLPLFGALLARAMGVARRDVIVSGMVDAKRRNRPQTATPTPDEIEAAAKVQDEPAESDDQSVVHASVESSASTPISAPSPDEHADSSESENRDEEPTRAKSAQKKETAQPSDVPATIGRTSLGSAARAALILAVITASVPVVLPLSIVLTVLLVIFSRARSKIWVLPLPSLALFAPLLYEMARSGEWELLLSGPGVALPYEPATSIQTALGLPSNITLNALPEFFVWLALVPLAVSALFAFLAFFRGGKRLITVRIGWLITATGLTVALASPHIAIARTPLGEVVRAWPGIGLTLLLLGLLMAALAGADSISEVLERHPFGWRHTSSAVLSGVAAASAVVAIVSGVWAFRADVPELSFLQPDQQNVTPALAQQLAAGEGRGRVLVLAPQADGTLGVEVWRSNGPQLTDHHSVIGARQISDPLGITAAELYTTDNSESRAEPADDLAEVVAAIVSGTSDETGEALARHAIGVVLIPPGDAAVAGARESLLSTMSSTPGLAYVTDNPSGSVWRVSTDGREGGATAVSRLLLAEEDGTTLQGLSSALVGANPELPDANETRLVLLAERADPAWNLSGDGRPLARIDHDWRQAFIVPASVESIELTYDPPWRPWWLATQALVIAVIGVLALPSLRRRDTE